MAATIAWRSVPGTSSPRAQRDVLNPREELAAPRLAELARLDDAAFRALFRKSPVKRIGRDRFVRNVLIAIGNSGDAALAPEARALLDDASPLVRGAAVWALERLLPREDFAGAGRRNRRDRSGCAGGMDFYFFLSGGLGAGFAAASSAARLRWPPPRSRPTGFQRQRRLKIRARAVKSPLSRLMLPRSTIASAFLGDSFSAASTSLRASAIRFWAWRALARSTRDRRAGR